jgi:hypothetical protein
MNCERCGGELTPGKHFCTHCGAAVPASQAQAPQAPPTPQTGAPAPAYVQPPMPPATPGRLSGRSTGWKVLAVVLGIIVLAGIVVGVFFVVKAAFPDKPTARVSLVTLTRKDGKALNLKKVPLDEDLTLTAVFQAEYPLGGKGTIRLYVEDQSGEELTGESYSVSSRGGAQKKQYTLNMTAGSGKPLKAVAKLVVTPPKGKKVTDTRSITYTAEKGTTEDDSDTNTDTSSDVETARANVEKDFEELMTTAQTANAAGVDISDVRNEIADLGVQLTDASTVEELDQIDTRIIELQEELQSRLVE